MTGVIEVDEWGVNGCGDVEDREKMYVVEEHVTVRGLSGVCRADANVALRSRMSEYAVYVVSDRSLRSRYRGDGECGEDQCLSNDRVLLGRVVGWRGVGKSISDVEMGI